MDPQILSKRKKLSYEQIKDTFLLNTKFKGPFKSFEYWGLKLLPGIRVIAEGLDL